MVLSLVDHLFLLRGSWLKDFALLQLYCYIGTATFSIPKITHRKNLDQNGGKIVSASISDKFSFMLNGDLTDEGIHNSCSHDTQDIYTEIKMQFYCNLKTFILIKNQISFFDL